MAAEAEITINIHSAFMGLEIGNNLIKQNRNVKWVVSIHTF
jgi:hypothetical protein